MLSQLHSNESQLEIKLYNIFQSIFNLDILTSKYGLQILCLIHVSIDLNLTNIYFFFSNSDIEYSNI